MKINNLGIGLAVSFLGVGVLAGITSMKAIESPNFYYADGSNISVPSGKRGKFKRNQRKKNKK